jgi:oligopeptide transport system substrate-binding protein
VGISYDPAAARDLLTQAGYTDTASFPRVTFIVNSYGDTAPGARYNMAVAMTEMWKTHLGVTVDVEVLQPPHYGERIRTDPPELFWNGWLPDPGNDPDFIRTIFQTDGEYNYGHFSNTDFDTLVMRASFNRVPAARQALYVEAERILCETEVGIIPLYHTFLNIP